MKLNIFGRLFGVARENDQWVLYSLGEGLKRRENDIPIPAELTQAEVVTFLADIFHEIATPDNSDVKVLE